MNLILSSVSRDTLHVGVNVRTMDIPYGVAFLKLVLLFQGLQCIATQPMSSIVTIALADLGRGARNTRPLSAKTSSFQAVLGKKLVKK